MKLRERRGLPELGFRFALLPTGKCGWIHPAEMPTDAIDCTDMDDARFEMAYMGVLDKLNTPKVVDTDE